MPEIAGSDETVLETERLLLRTARPDEADAVLEFFVRNEPHLGPWEPARPPGFFTVALWRERLAQYREHWLVGGSYRLHLFEKREPRRVVGSIGLTNVVRGVFQNALLMQMTIDDLHRAGFEVLVHQRVPANDGGLALGQTALARGWGRTE